MALNPEFVGRSYAPDGSYVVGREKIREFATAIDDASPVFHDVEAARSMGYADLVAPPTFAAVLSLKASGRVIRDPQLGLDYSRVVHGEQRFVYSRPIVAGDELNVTTTIETIRTMAGNDMITTRGDVTTLDGEPVVTTYSLLISRGPDEETS
ncbi:MAG: MaoC family dehydratase N-terminal domain-containing protein [Candidatus Nanopelagicales bacterium]|nr:MaoC family dehydratase N-terminal domain-containing protein [Candidatus Nanopelagicales bacterium]MCF8538641.1 MaoC family dehydratase N-terminal domain-containing protein [Candidatus Nanopelagicales bacterium]MCF8558271.1 MaoC family dehydratase N-terminal domain-containing protein [Candidatus Nanopelagicales bacterium]